MRVTTGGASLATSFRCDHPREHDSATVNNHTPGQALQALVDGAERDLVLVAPFMKARVLDQLLKSVSDEVGVRCVTRWKPGEIAAGVSDLDVFDVLSSRPRASLRLLPHLHAKYFRADERCLVGSANLTASALGWISPCNVEILVEVAPTDPRLQEFEHFALSEALIATAELRSLMEAAAEEVLMYQRELEVPISATWRREAEDRTYETAPSAMMATWLPVMRQPRDLYLAYIGRGDELSEASREAALRDLVVLDPPVGLPREAFTQVIAAILLQMPMLAEIDEYVARPRRFGAVRDLLASKTGQGRSQASDAWQTTMRWLLEFAPDRYRRTVPSHSEVFGRVLDTALTGPIPRSPADRRAIAR